MSHDTDHSEPEFMDDPEAGSTWFFSLVSVVLMAVTIFGLVAIYFGFADVEVEEKVLDRKVRSLEKLRLAQETTLQETGTYEIETVDGETATRIRIPIEDAMSLVLAEQRSRTDAGESNEEAVASR